MDAKFIKCKRGGLETIYTTHRESKPEDIIRLADDTTIYLKLYTDDILNFKVRPDGIIAEVVSSVGKLPVLAWDYSTAFDENISDRMKPIIFISASDIDALENFEKLVEIPDLHSEILNLIVKD